LHLPYATVRRHLDQLVETGYLLRTDSGFLCTDQALQIPSMQDTSVMIGRRFISILARLAARGFPFDAPAKAYAVGRPPLLSFSGSA
jgi:DNA-binding IclR family transcriptional regulator